MRRCGKSTVLRLFGEQLLAEGIDRSTIISINFESMGEDYPPSMPSRSTTMSSQGYPQASITSFSTRYST